LVFDIYELDLSLIFNWMCSTSIWRGDTEYDKRGRTVPQKRLLFDQIRTCPAAESCGIDVIILSMQHLVHEKKARWHDFLS
jgi:hypothetical protein